MKSLIAFPVEFNITKLFYHYNLIFTSSKKKFLLI
jgi:hypothetical protein